jgi:hypothetical protein
MKTYLALFLPIVAVLVGSGCVRNNSITFVPHAYRNIKTWDVAFLLNADEVIEETTKETGGKETTVKRHNGQGSSAWAIREDIFYCMKGEARFNMVTKGEKADAVVKVFVDSDYMNGNFGVITLTVFNAQGEALSRLKYQNNEPSMSLDSRSRAIASLVGQLVEEVNANK